MKARKVQKKMPSSLLKEPSPDLFPSKSELPKLFAVLAMAASVAIACNYAVTILNRPPKPFCDSSSSLSDSCKPCPSNAECSNGNWKCVQGYKKQGKLCVKAGDIDQTAKKLSDWVEHHLCEAYAQVLCDGTGTIWVCYHDHPPTSMQLVHRYFLNEGDWSDNGGLVTVNFQQAEILMQLDEYKLKKKLQLVDDIFTLSKHKAMENIGSSMEMRTNFDGITELKCPDHQVGNYKPLLCCIRQWIYGYAFILLPVSALLIGLMRVLLRVHRSRYLARRAEELYEQVCDMLEENATTLNTSSKGESWVVASQLRDHLLPLKERKNTMLWKKVEELVQEDSRVDQYPKMVKGESKIVWEWQVEGSLSSKRRGREAASKTISSNDRYQFSIPQRSKPPVGKILNS